MNEKRDEYVGDGLARPAFKSGESSMWFEQAVKQINDVDGDIALLVKNLRTGEVFSYKGEDVFPSASIIKVPILISLIDEAAESRLSLSSTVYIEKENTVGGAGVIQYLSGLPYTLMDLATLMIITSDNTATNKLIEILTMDTVNKTCKDLRLSSTVLGRKMMDFEAQKRGADNYTSCEDMLKLFEFIYNNPEKYALALKILKQQLLKDLLPFTCKPFEFAHKTGQLNGVRHDVGIMYLKEPIFVAFMSKNLKNELDGVRLANYIGALLLEAFGES